MTKSFKTTLLDQHLRKARVSVLEADIKTRQKLVCTIYDNIADRQKRYAKDRVALESLAFQLHNLYCAFECLFRIVDDHFENRLIDQKARNKKLLNRMKLNIAGIRPSFISDPAFVLLNDLRDFRHVIRHDYKVKLEPAQMKIVLNKALALKIIYKKDIATFLARLKAKTKR
jgi:hypothetical protein